MLIVLGGLLGSGRQKLASRLSLDTGIYRYDIEQKKIKKNVLQKDGDLGVRQPRSDEERIWVYTRALEEFRLLAKMRPDMIVDDTFHRRAPRDFFLSGAQKYFEPAIFVWIEADEGSAQKNIEKMFARGKVGDIERALRARKKGQKMSEMPENALIFRFQDGIELKAQAGRLWQQIQEVLRYPHAKESTEDE